MSTAKFFIHSFGVSTFCHPGVQVSRICAVHLTVRSAFLLCRRCVRRQSATRSQEREPAENLFEIEDVKFPVSNSRDKSMKENGLTPPSSITKEEICEPRNEAQGSHRFSIGRPSRKAAEKVQSYKEVPINVKMRRAEWAEFHNVQQHLRIIIRIIIIYFPNSFVNYD